MIVSVWLIWRWMYTGSAEHDREALWYEGSCSMGETGGRSVGWYAGGLEWWRCHSFCMAFWLAMRVRNRGDMVDDTAYDWVWWFVCLWFISYDRWSSRTM